MTRILHLSDPHFGAADPAVAEKFIARAAELGPALTLISGDLTMRARRSELAAARDFANRLPRPLMVIPGNHDIPAMNQPIDRFFRPFHRYRDSFGRELEPERIDRGIHVVAMNSNRAFGFHADWSEGRVSGESLARADRRFAARSAEFRILMLHHPLIAPPEYGRDVVKPLPALLSMIGGRQVDLVLCGHFHRSHLAALPAGPWSCVVSQASTVCSTRLQGEPQGFHVIDRSGDQLEITRHRFRGTDFVEGESFRYVRGTAGWDPADARSRQESDRIP